MATTIEQIGQQYPNTAERLQQLPEHLAEHVGEAVLRLSHVDMHPAETQVSPEGKEFQKIDFSRVITDPEFDASELEAQTVDAARAGKEKLANILHTSAGLLETAHKSLVEAGSVFGAQEVETDEARAARESREREAVYKEALNLTVEAAMKANAEGRQDDEVQLLESLLILNHMSPLKERPLFRRIVRAGMADGLLKAGRESTKLFAGDGYKRVADGSHLNGGILRAGHLLEFATGKKLDDYDLSSQGKLDLNKAGNNYSFEDVQDLLAVATMPDSDISLERALDFASSWRCIEKVKERAAVVSPDEIDSILSGLSEIVKPDDLEETFNYSDPVHAYQAAKQLGIEVWEVKSLFGQSVEGSELLEVNTEQVAGMLELKQAFPDYFSQLKDRIWRRRVTSPYDPKQILEGIRSLDAAGSDDPILFEGLCNYPNVPEYTEACIKIADQLKTKGMTVRQLGELVGKGDYSDVSQFVDFCIEGGVGNVATTVERLMTNGEIFDNYLKAYSKITYPLSSLKETIPVPELVSLPTIEKRLQQLGLSGEVASAMFASWATYSAYSANFYNNTDGFNLPNEAPDQRTLESIARRQAQALESQMESLETYASTYGVESMNQIITNFGIYNFSRHGPQELFDQNERWVKGEPVKAVVVNSRYDWNSFTGENPVFENVEGYGLFIFEANSGTEAARVAVRVGQRERQLGREPDVKHFILHAHGNPEGMVMGVNREAIDTTSYLQAFRDRTRIASAEINDYKKHLGQNFEVVLQSCSTAGETVGQNIAQAISEQHDVKVVASKVTIHGLTILSDGTVKFSTNEPNNEPVIYSG